MIFVERGSFKSYYIICKHYVVVSITFSEKIILEEVLLKYPDLVKMYFLYFWGMLFSYQINCEKYITDTYKRIEGEKSFVL